LDNNASPFVSLNTSRLHHQLFPNWIEVPPSFNNNTISFLETNNHRIVRVEQYQSAAQAIARLRNGTFWAASEPMQLQSGAFGV
jgi:gamma-glutamyltranspeptidase